MIDKIKMNPTGSNPNGTRTVHYRTIKSVLFILFLALLIISLGVQPAIAQKMPSRSEAAGAVPGIVIKSETAVNGDRIYLKDILDSSSDSKLAEKIGNLVVGHSPRPGDEQKLTGSWIVSTLRSKKWLPEDAEISAPKYIRISRAYQNLDPQHLERVFCNYIASKVGKADFKVSQFKVRGSDKFPTGRMTFNILKPIPKTLYGRVSLRIAVAVGGKESGRLTLSGWIDRFESVLCANRYLPRNTVLTEDDLKMQQMNISKAPANLVTALQDAVGKRLKQDLKSGETLRHNMLSVPPLIHKGDKVKMVAQNGSLRIVTLGIAESSGGLGDQIRIENSTSKKTVVGRVKDHSTVEVIF
ncbi:MAG TPA: flagellar basal body P-ring formation protein FlgA [Deltaproteobacteria bacterium]|nr:flagellar basal body P-ring formation protein FlgA [Deltaproteobacteria bacterium]